MRDRSPLSLSLSLSLALPSLSLSLALPSLALPSLSLSLFLLSPSPSSPPPGERVLQSAPGEAEEVALESLSRRLAQVPFGPPGNASYVWRRPHIQAHQPTSTRTLYRCAFGPPGRPHTPLSRPTNPSHTQPPPGASCDTGWPAWTRLPPHIQARQPYPRHLAAPHRLSLPPPPGRSLPRHGQASASAHHLEEARRATDAAATEQAALDAALQVHRWPAWKCCL